MRVNLGCGPSPTPGWVNIDNSLTVRLARIPAISALIGRKSFIHAVRQSQIRYGTALHTGLPAGSADVIYSSHMLEHLDRREARLFLAEARRLLKPGGILRLAVPDLQMIAERYGRDGDADGFMTALGIELDKPTGLVARLRYAFLTGFRLHHWMYDAASLEQAACVGRLRRRRQARARRDQDRRSGRARPARTRGREPLSRSRPGRSFVGEVQIDLGGLEPVRIDRDAPGETPDRLPSG